jgi:hypothetical protein
MKPAPKRRPRLMASTGTERWKYMGYPVAAA